MCVCACVGEFSVPKLTPHPPCLPAWLAGWLLCLGWNVVFQHQILTMNNYCMYNVIEHENGKVRRRKGMGQAWKSGKQGGCFELKADTWFHCIFVTISTYRSRVTHLSMMVKLEPG